MNYDDITVVLIVSGDLVGGGVDLSYNQMYMKSMTVGHGGRISVGG
jgi:hypothetical protein